MDKALYVLFAIQGALMIMRAILNYDWFNNHALKHWYIPYVHDCTNFKQEAVRSCLSACICKRLLTASGCNRR